MTRKIASLSLSLLFAGALAVLAQSPTTSAPPGQGATQDPYGATMDHPNPGSVAAPSSANTSSTDNTPSSTTTTTTTSTSSPATGTSTSGGTDTSVSTPSSLPKTGSDLPLFAALGCLAMAGACGLRAVRTRA